MDRRTGFQIIYATDEQGAYVPCDVTYGTLSLSRKSGGDIRTLHAVVPTGSMVDLQRNRMVNLVPVADRGQRRGTEVHVHIPLILAVNGQWLN